MMHRLARVPLEALRQHQLRVPFIDRRVLSLATTPTVVNTTGHAAPDACGSESLAEGVVTGFASDGRALVRLGRARSGANVGNSSASGEASREVVASGQLLMRGLRVQLTQLGDSGEEWRAVPIPGERQRRPKSRCIHPTRAGGLCKDCPRRKTGRT
mmetsp:Transcript_139306/g.277806  ORF Transcript_139306/g.277806 Transcript_139306/m.277806 type:complete len:157 (+) Transcript_139306:3-473(+)